MSTSIQKQSISDFAFAHQNISMTIRKKDVEPSKTNHSIELFQSKTIDETLLYCGGYVTLIVIVCPQ